MKLKATRSSAPSAAALALVLAACSGTATVEVRPGQGSGVPAAATADTTASSGPPTSALCSVGDANNGPEYYRFEPMNRKLKYYPDFAASVGLDNVSDCQSARTFMQGYFDYLRTHPGFDTAQPFEYPQEALPPRPAEQPGSIEVSKILNGQTDTNLPVVKLEFTNTPSKDPTIKAQYSSFTGAICTGAFISKNVILTAAHCIANAAVQACIENNQTVPNCQPKWLNYHRWAVHFSNFDLYSGNEPTVWALSDVHPDWFGRGYHPGTLYPASDTPDFPSAQLSTYDSLVGAKFDIGLLYIDDDSILPYDVESNGAKRLALLPPPLAPDGTLTGDLQFYGWGAVDDNSPNALHSSALMPALTLSGDDIINGRTLTPLDSASCPGDSGGPLVRTVNVQTNDGSDQDVEAILGVTSTGPGASDVKCAMPSEVPVGNTDSNWTRVDTESAQTFITRFIDRFYGPYFRCKQRPTTDGSQATMVVSECWGAPCTDVDGCTDQPDGYYCSQPGGDLEQTSCATCDTQGGGCDCVIGQCLPGPMSVPPPDLPN